MQGVNRVELIGHLGADPEVKTLASGDLLANLRLATTESWKDQSGQRQERTEWHRVVAYGPIAGILEQYASKGSALFLAGQLRTRKWQDQSGQDRYTTEVVLSGPKAEIRLLDRRPEGPSSGQASSRRAPAARPAPPPPADGGAPFDDDLPFDVYQRGWLA